MQITQRALDPETSSPDGIAMGTAHDESHFVPSRSQPPTEIAPDRPSCHDRYPHVPVPKCEAYSRELRDLLRSAPNRAG